MPRPYKPAQIFLWPLPEQLSGATSTCPVCDQPAKAQGVVGERTVYRCESCGTRFKPYPMSRAHAWDH